MPRENGQIGPKNTVHGLEGRLPAPYRAETRGPPRKSLPLPSSSGSSGNVGYNYICCCGDASLGTFPLNSFLARVFYWQQRGDIASEGLKNFLSTVFGLLHYPLHTVRCWGFRLP